MPTIVMSKLASRLDPSVRKKAFAFLEKLTDNDTTPGLHIEPIANSADPRVRTGRVDQSYRAVLFKIPAVDDTTYVFHGIWPHDDAIEVARKTVLRLNPVNGVAEIRIVEPRPAPAPRRDTPPVTAAAPQPLQPQEPQRPPADPGPAVPLLPGLGVTRDDLIDTLGIDSALADCALAAPDEDAVLTVAADAIDATDAIEWQGLALLDLAGGTSVTEVRTKFALEPAPDELTAPDATEDEKLLQGLRRPAAQISFTYIEGSEELRRVIEGGDFGAWRVFLHPEQRSYAERTYRGPFRLSGGAGTGKTVVVLHRARNLAGRDPRARILVTTFTTNLADAVRTDLRRLQPDLLQANKLGDPGLYVTGIDALAGAVLWRAQGDITPDVQAVLGADGGQIGGRFAPSPWREALDAAGARLPERLRSEAFLAAEYSAVILPNRITTREEYLRVRRPGRGVALDRAKRAAVWDVVAACRAQARVAGTLDFPEATAIAAAHRERVADDDRLFEHVLVDEGQDLSPVHWQLLRALVGEHADDLFIAEDSHQRIYGRRVVLGQYGIRIVGRSRRLTLNYRTTAQTLAYALGILRGGDYVDLEDTRESATAYRSARSGPGPQIIGSGSLTKELDAAARTISDWVDRTDAPETIAVLVRDRWARDRVVAGLAERGVQIRSVDRESIRPGQAVAMTMHRAKGTEFSKVLLFDVSRDSIPAALKDQKYSEDASEDALLRERSLLYVAATRARDELAVTYKGSPSVLVEPLVEP
jgi:superfamily I DNA/RNA helicase